MVIVIEKIRRELRAAWARESGSRACRESLTWSDEQLEIGTMAEQICVSAADLVGASFSRRGSVLEYRRPYDLDDCAPCAEALIAQWYGLAPVVKMPRKKRAAK